MTETKNEIQIHSGITYKLRIGTCVFSKQSGQRNSIINVGHYLQNIGRSVTIGTVHVLFGTFYQILRPFDFLHILFLALLEIYLFVTFYSSYFNNVYWKNMLTKKFVK